MQTDPVQHRNRITAIQPIDGWQSEPYDPFMEQYRLMCAGMLSTFVGDLERYRRLQRLGGKRSVRVLKTRM